MTNDGGFLSLERDPRCYIGDLSDREIRKNTDGLIVADVVH